jgi:hypothetical protein
MKITFNVNKDRFEVHSFNFLESSILAASIIGGVSFWIIASIMLIDPSYR